jgi:hypothetical protein
VRSSAVGAGCRVRSPEKVRSANTATSAYPISSEAPPTGPRHRRDRRPTGRGRAGGSIKEEISALSTNDNEG